MQTENIKSSKGKITYKEVPIRLTADVSAETLQSRREWQDTFKVMKGKNLQPRLLYPARVSFRFDGEIKTFIDKQKNSAPRNQLYNKCYSEYSESEYSDWNIPIRKC